jgi:hypothetical protein
MNPAPEINRNYRNKEQNFNFLYCKLNRDGNRNSIGPWTRSKGVSRLETINSTVFFILESPQAMISTSLRPQLEPDRVVFSIPNQYSKIPTRLINSRKYVIFMACGSGLLNKHEQQKLQNTVFFLSFLSAWPAHKKFYSAVVFVKLWNQIP